MLTIFFSEFLKDFARNSYKEHHHVEFSKEFFDCADNQLCNFFILKTGIVPSKKVGLSCLISPECFYYEKGKVSSFPIDIYINHN